ncbi:hypothetical protein ACVWWR_005438 [Bradyrhizobium sp. LM3.2]
MHDKPRRSDLSSDIREQLCHGLRFACIAGVATYAVHLFESLKDGFFRIPGCDGDTHSVFREQPGATRTDARATADNKCDVLLERLCIAVGFSHVVSSCTWCRPAYGVATQAAPLRNYCFTAITTLPFARPVST